MDVGGFNDGVPGDKDSVNCLCVGTNGALSVPSCGLMAIKNRNNPNTEPRAARRACLAPQRSLVLQTGGVPNMQGVHAHPREHKEIHTEADAGGAREGNAGDADALLRVPKG
ncbi:hypothetical protein RRF57_009963 [Xylaria bambusicola]|uniref:Uncharacterized protein n=1 Tax=Xylaria bambusicola TaxID=326684 RepID=A0AAN7V365_9PEZI